MKKGILRIVVVLGCLMLSSLVFQESSFAQIRDTGYVYLSDIEPVEELYSCSKVGRDCRLTSGGSAQDLVVGGYKYKKGLGTHAFTWVTYQLNGEYNSFQTLLGVNSLAGVSASIVFIVYGDEKKLYESKVFTKFTTPEKITILIKGVKKLTLALSNAEDGNSSDHGNWIDAVVLKKGVNPPPSSRAEEVKKTLNIKGDYYKYNFSLPANNKGYWVTAKNYLDELNPEIAPVNIKQDSISTFATPGEYEPAAFVIYSLEDINNVDIKIGDLISSGNRISRKNIEIRKVVRAPHYGRRNKFKNFVITSKQLFKFTPFDLKKGEFREIWLTVKVPEGTKQGIYKSKIQIKPKNKPVFELILSLEILPFRLEKAPKAFAMKCESNPFLKEETFLRLKDIKEHYISQIYSYSFLAIRYEYPGAKLGYFIPKRIDYSKIKVDYSYIEKMLCCLREAGFSGPVVINDKIDELAEFFGYRMPRMHEKDRLYEEWGERILKDEEFKKLVKKVISGLKEIEKKYPEFEFWLIHMDEVFNVGRLPYYIALTKIAQEAVPGYKFIQFFHTVNEEAEKMRKLIDPYVDIRGNHGYTFEWWLTRGHTFKEYEKELKESGDIAYFYHNLRGYWVAAEWQRIINGLYMWINPFHGRLDASYNNYSGSPFAGGAGFGTDEFLPLRGDITPVPTRHWEAWREGVDDLKYIHTLEEIIEKYLIEDREGEVDEAIAYLEKIKKSLPNPQKLKPGRSATAEESPFINAIANKFSGDDYQKMRYKIASYIIELKKGLK